MTNSPRLTLPYIEQNQAQKEITHADALNILDGLVQSVVRGIGQNIPPTTPVNGDLFVVGATPIGAWAGQANKIAHYVGTGWQFRTAFNGTLVYSREVDALYYFNGTSWLAYGVDRVQTISADSEVPLSAIKLIAADLSSDSVALRLPGSTFVPNGHKLQFKITEQATSYDLTLFAAENRLLHSSDLSNAAWAKSQSAITANAMPGPYAQASAQKLTELATSATHEASQSYSKGAGVTKIAVSCYYRASERNDAYIYVDDGTTTNRITTRINLTNGTIPVQSSAGTFTLDAVTSQNIGDGWWRLILYCDVPTGTTTIRIILRLYDGASTNYLGVLNSGVFFYGAEVSHSVPQSSRPIETAGTQILNTIDGSGSKVLSLLNEVVELTWSGSQWLVTGRYEE